MSTIRVCFSSLVLMFLLMSCQPQSGTNLVEFKVPVTVAEVGLATVEDLIITTGTVRAPELIKLTVMTSGLLQINEREGRRLAEGDSIKSGELIATITGEDVRLASKMRLVAQDLEHAKQELEAIAKLFSKNLVSSSTNERAKTTYEKAKLEYEKSLHSENRNKITSPIDGIILKLARDKGQLMANGQLVNPGQVIAEVASLDSVIADVNLVGKDIARVKPGLVARANYFAWKEQEFSGRVLRLSPTIDERTRSLRAQIEIENKNLLLKPGMFVEVSLVVERRENVLVVPRRSLTQRGGRRVVFVVNGQRVEQREIELGLSDDLNVEILKGLKVGEKVVVLGLETLSDRMSVRVTGG
ncbi:MAG: efflux RND transporter periplasmic adaptor subunit [Alteromonadaceae bacterium]|nr:efflux RND transporter periplasmic adaptor subunit [Alteromonadaceae bacterium]